MAAGGIDTSVFSQSSEQSDQRHTTAGRIDQLEEPGSFRESDNRYIAA